MAERRQHIVGREQLEGLQEAYNVLPGLSFLFDMLGISIGLSNVSLEEPQNNKIKIGKELLDTWSIYQNHGVTSCGTTRKKREKN
jgi:hypothetical protein